MPNDANIPRAGQYPVNSLDEVYEILDTYSVGNRITKLDHIRLKNCTWADQELFETRVREGLRLETTYVASAEDAERLAKWDVVANQKILVWQLDKAHNNKTFFEWAANYVIACYPTYYKTPANMAEFRQSQALTETNKFANDNTLSILSDDRGQPFQEPAIVARLPSEVKRRLLEDSIAHWQSKMRSGQLRTLEDEQLASRKPQVKYGDDYQQAILESKEAEKQEQREKMYQKSPSKRRAAAVNIAWNTRVLSLLSLDDDGKQLSFNIRAAYLFSSDTDLVEKVLLGTEKTPDITRVTVAALAQVVAQGHNWSAGHAYYQGPDDAKYAITTDERLQTMIQLFNAEKRNMILHWQVGEASEEDIGRALPRTLART